MTEWMWALAGFMLGAVTVAGWLRARYAGVAAGWRTETSLLRERVNDLETALATDQETAATLAPLRDALTRVESQVGVLERDRVAQFGSLEAVMTKVAGETQQLGRVTSDLAGSLRSSTTRGSWGEVQLRRVLEISGMLPRCDFDEQTTIVRADRSRQRPDVVVRLPRNGSIVIDAKAPMTSFLKAQADHLDDLQRTDLMAAHASELAHHVAALASREYWAALPDSPEFVVCFVPTEAMLASALAAKPDLYEQALERHVVVVGPGSLLALLRTVALAWHQDSLTDNARELLALGRELYRRLGTLGTRAAQLGTALTKNVEAYNALVGTLESRVLVTARQLQDLDVASGDITRPAVIEATARPLTAAELIDHVTADNSRPEVVHDTTPAATPRHEAAG